MIFIQTKIWISVNLKIVCVLVSIVFIFEQYFLTIRKKAKRTFYDYTKHAKSTKVYVCFAQLANGSKVNNELYRKIYNNSIRNNLRPVSSLLGLIRQAQSRETAVVIYTTLA